MSIILHLQLITKHIKHFTHSKKIGKVTKIAKNLLEK